MKDSCEKEMLLNCEKEMLLKCYRIRQCSKRGTPSETGLLETGQIPTCSGTAWQKSACPKPSTPGLNTLLCFLNAPSMSGHQATGASASKKQMTSPQNRDTTLQPSPRINAISLWDDEQFGKRWTWARQRMCSGQSLFRYYSFSVGILSKKRHLCCSF